MILVSKVRVCAAALLVSLLALASTAAAGTEAAAEPDLAAMALALSDFPAGTKVSSQRFVRSTKPATRTYSRIFAEGTRLGSARLLALENEMSLYATAAVAGNEVREFRQLISTRRGREIFADVVATQFKRGSKLKLQRVVVSTPTSLGAGQSSVHVATTFVLAARVKFTVHLAFVQTDRVVATLVLSPTPGQKLTRGHLRQIGGLQANRLRQGFTVANLAAPAISGTPSPAQTLTASSGDWSGSPSSYTFQWSRCDSAGTTCTDIAGATAATYTVVPEDIGFALRATVTGRNSVSSASATSPVTAPVA